MYSSDASKLFRNFRRILDDRDNFTINLANPEISAEWARKIWVYMIIFLKITTSFLVGILDGE